MTSSRHPADRPAPHSHGSGAPTASPIWRRLTLGLVALQAVLVLATFRDYGITYDEYWHSTYGYHVIHWYLSGFQDQGAFTYWTLNYEGAFFNVVARVLANLLPLDDFETGHLLGGLFCVLGTLFTARLAGFLGGARAGFLAALLLVTAPRFYGHGFANARDIPMAVLAVATLDGLARMLPHLPRPGLARLAAVGVPLGLSMAVRVGSVFLLGYLAMALVLWTLVRRLGTPQAGASLGRDALAAARAFGLVVAITWACMLPWWPKALLNPLWPIQSFVYTTQEFGYDIAVFFRGETISNQSLPWDYVLTWFLLVTPEHLLAAAALALLAGLAWLARAPARSLEDSARVLLPRSLPLVAVLLPLGYVTLHGAVDYDGIRHFLFVLPPLCVLAALGLERCLTFLGSPAPRAGLAALLLAPLALTLVDMLRLHPYQYVYFNRVVAGGLAGAHGRYDTEYWGASYKEAVEWVVDHYERPDLDRPIRVASNSYSESTSHYLPPGRFEYLGSYEDGKQIEQDAPPPDLYLSTLRWDGPERLPGRIVHTVERMGVPLCHVIEVREP